MINKWFVLGLSCLLLFACNRRGSEERYVVVLSMDGFRSRYVGQANTPTLDSLAQVGVRSALIPCFPSVTFPNHYSMATGLHPDHHGLVNNSFYDAGLKKEYKMSDRSAVQDPVFYGGEPIWATAEKQGVKSASFFWVGSETPVQGIQPSIWKKFDNRVPFEARADSVIHWLSLPEKIRPHLVMWYMEEPDHTGHVYSPDSIQAVQMVEHLDSLLGAFLAKARSLPVYDQIDFVFVADHGMATYTPDRYVNLADYLPRDRFDYVYDGVPTLLYPKKTYVDTAYAILKQIPHIQVWHKGNVPERFVYGRNSRIGELIVLPDIGTMLHFKEKSHPIVGGAHGYDNALPEMQAIFYAAGPSFKKNYVQEPMPNVNIYLLITKLLAIQPAPNDGDSRIVERLIK